MIVYAKGMAILPPHHENRVLLIGEAPTPTNDGNVALRVPAFKRHLCDPSGLDGWPDHHWDCCNVFDEPQPPNRDQPGNQFPVTDAAMEFTKNVMKLVHYERIVLLGARVWSAFSRAFGPDIHMPDGGVSSPNVQFGDVRSWTRSGRTRQLLILPHPSGVNRAWNDPHDRARYHETFRYFVASEEAVSS